jgi:hypothetical protein
MTGALYMYKGASIHIHESFFFFLPLSFFLVLSFIPVHGFRYANCLIGAYL